MRSLNVLRELTRLDNISVNGDVHVSRHAKYSDIW